MISDAILLHSEVFVCEAVPNMNSIETLEIVYIVWFDAIGLKFGTTVTYSSVIIS